MMKGLFDIDKQQNQRCYWIAKIINLIKERTKDNWDAAFNSLLWFQLAVLEVEGLQQYYDELEKSNKFKNYKTDFNKSMIL